MSIDRPYRIIVVPIFLTLFLSQQLLAQSSLDGMQLAQADEELLFGDIPSVFSASKYEQKVTEAPARVNVITADEIQRYGHRTFLDIINSIPGFQSSFDRNYSYVGVRGFGIPSDYNTRILLLVDGHRINENLYDGTVLDRGFVVDIDLIKRVEVVRGPASSLYGSSAFFGVINVITKRGRDLQATELSVAAGSQNNAQGRVSYGNKYDNGFEVLVSASGFEGDGDDRKFYAEFDDPATNNGIAEDAENADNYNLFAKFGYEEFTVTAIYEKYKKGISTASYDTVFNDPRTITTEGHTFLDFKYQHITDAGGDVTARLYYDDYWYDGDWVYDYADPGDPPDLTIFKDEADGDWWGVETLVTQEWFEHHRTTLGFEYRESLKEFQTEFDIFEVYLDSNTDSDVLSLYVQDEYRVRDDLILNLGLRFDDYSTVGSTTNPRVALIWTANEPTTFKFLYGTAFRAPNPYELYYNDGDLSQKVSQGLEPETIETFEIIMDRRLNDQLNLTASIFHNHIEDLIALTTDPADDLLIIKNTGDFNATGSEIELQGHWDDGWSGSASYSYQDAEDETGKRMINSPLNMLKFNVIAPLAGDDFSAGLEIQYEDERKTLGGNTTDSRVIGNLTFFSRNWIGGMKISASVYNLTDEDYAVPGSEEHVQDQIEQDGRTFRVKFDYAF